MLLARDSPPNFDYKKTADQQTPISTGVLLPAPSESRLPASEVVKPIWIGKLVNKYLKQMDSQQRIYQSLKKKRRHKSSNRLPQIKKSTFKIVNQTTKKRPAGRKLRQDFKVKHDFRDQKVLSKRKNNSKSSRKRVQTTVSGRAAHSQSLTRKPLHKASKQIANSTSEQSRKQPSSLKKLKSRAQENHPFSIYFKDSRNLRY